MNVLVVGDNDRFLELRKKLPGNVQTQHFSFWDIVKGDRYACVFDLNFDEWPRSIEFFISLKDTPVFVSAVKKNLAETVQEYGEEPQCFLIGMNMLPGFIEREVLEISLFKNDRDRAQEVMQQFGWNYKIVADRVGLVTPRILCMIINEACYTLQEGTATVADIDLAMKLGTNYPHGPFEWAEKIGIKEVYETLLAIYADTHDERYKICPLLKQKYLRGERFL